MNRRGARPRPLRGSGPPTTRLGTPTWTITNTVWTLKPLPLTADTAVNVARQGCRGHHALRTRMATGGTDRLRAVPDELPRGSSGPGVSLAGGGFGVAGSKEAVEVAGGRVGIFGCGWAPGAGRGLGWILSVWGWRAVITVCGRKCLKIE